MACGSNNGFPSAAEARNCARDNKVVFEEICVIQQAILDAIVSKVYQVVISDGSPMTTQDDIDPVDGNPDSIQYYKVFAEIEDGREIQDQLDFVERYFTNLGYNVQLQINPSTENTLQWVLLW